MKTIRKTEGGFTREFTANGRQYTIRTAEEGVGIMRHTKMMQMGAVLGMAATFAQLHDNIRRAEECFNSLVTAKPRMQELGVLLNNMRRGVLETSRERYSYAFHYCTFFITWEGEDLTAYNEEEQQTKIDDWNAEGINEQDFLALGLSMVAGFISVYQDYSARMIENRERISDTIELMQEAQS